jgi:hypothetical protein
VAVIEREEGESDEVILDDPLKQMHDKGGKI